MRMDARLVRSTEINVFLRKLGSPQLAGAIAAGLNEHAGEQRRQSVTRVAMSTGIPANRMATKTKVIPAVPAQTMTSIIETADQAIGLHVYGRPVWVRDLNPMSDGIRGGSVSSMRGAEATAWNIRRQFKGAFMMNGRVVIRKGKGRLPVRTLYSAVLPNELSKPERPNAPAAMRFAQVDLDRRVTRHVMRYLGV